MTLIVDPFFEGRPLLDIFSIFNFKFHCKSCFADVLDIFIGKFNGPWQCQFFTIPWCQILTSQWFLTNTIFIDAKSEISVKR